MGVHSIVLVVFVCSLVETSSPTNISCKNTNDCKMSEYKRCCFADTGKGYCSERKYCDNHCQVPNDCGDTEFCVDGTCSTTSGPGTVYCDSDKDCYGVNAGHRDLECISFRCLSRNCISCPTSCKNGACESKKSSDDSYEFSPASVIGFTAVVIIGSCIACALYCGCARRRQQPNNTQAEVHQTRDQQDQNPTPPPSPPLPRDAPPPYHSLEMIDRISPPPPSYDEAIRISHNSINNV